MLRRIGRVIGWAAFGLAGSATIFGLWLYVTNAEAPINLQTGGIVHTSNWDAGWVSAHGTWVIENDRQAFPLQITRITCLRSEGGCTAATATMSFDNTMTVDMETLKLVRWTEDLVVLANTAPLCVDYTYTISRLNRRMVGTRSPKGSLDALCDIANKQPLQMSLADGMKVSTELQREVKARTEPFMWASLAVLWMLVASRIFRRKSSVEIARLRA